MRWCALATPRCWGNETALSVHAHLRHALKCLTQEIAESLLMVTCGHGRINTVL
uniref:Uncharacterized protein n=1 Tax=Arundo donax TaxID=35708 RepID=A0A0A9F7Q5_ARUDO